MKSLKKLFVVFFVVGIVSVLGACGDDSASSGEEGSDGGNNLSMGTGGTTGVYYPVGSAIAQAINTSDEYKVNVQSTGGSIANMKMADEGEIELFLSASNTAFAGYSGDDPFDKPIEKIRSIGALYPETFQFIVKEDSGMSTIEDLEGKKVAVGAPGSGTERTGRLMLEAHGITYDDITAEFLGFGDAVTSLKDNEIDAAIVGSGIPTAAVVDASSSMDISLLNVNQEKFESFIEDEPFVITNTIEGGTYEGVEEDVITAASPALLMSSTDVSEDDVYEMTKLLFDNLEIVQDAHVQGENVTFESAVEGLSIKLHPGAVKYYEEQGLDVSEYK